LENPEWKEDRIPEVFNGQNVYDFIDPDIEAKLKALEEEEEQLEAQGFYDEEEEEEDEEEAAIREKAEYIREKQQLIRNAARTRKALKNRAIIPRSAGKGKNISEVEEALEDLGHDTSKVRERLRAQSRGRSRAREDDGDADMMDIDGDDRAARLKSRMRSQSNRRDVGITDEMAKAKAEKISK